MWNCELKTRLSDIISDLRNNCRQIVTQQLQKRFSTMSLSTILFNSVRFKENSSDIALIAFRFSRAI